MYVSLTTQRAKAEPGLHATVSLLYPLWCPNDLYLGLHRYALISQLFFFWTFIGLFGFVIISIFFWAYFQKLSVELASKF